MNWETKNITNSLRARFIKNMDIPIQVVKDPYFAYYLSLYDGQYRTMEKWDEFKASLNQFQNEEEYFASEKQFIDTIIGHISSKPSFCDFIKMDMKKFESSSLKKGNVFSEENVGKIFTSIDLVKANFQSLKYIDGNIVDGRDTYEEFASQFTEVPHFISSKKIRQVIFGNLCPQRQQTVQKHLISVIQGCLLSIGIPSSSIIASSSDEVVIGGDLDKIEFNEFKDLHNIADIRLSRFKLEKLGTDKFSFLVKKDLTTGEAKIKGVNSAYIPEVLKFQMGVKAIEWDRMFYLDGRLCFFQESLF
jgi:hypothetical protein